MRRSRKTKANLFLKLMEGRSNYSPEEIRDQRQYLMNIEKIVKGHLNLVERFFKENQWGLLILADEIARTIKDGGKILLFGNGGSAADAQHIAAEFVNRLDKKRRAIPAIALTTDSSIITSVANDSSFRQIFSRQIEALAKEGDIAIGISTSGKSSNVYNGLQLAHRKGLKTSALLGRDGGIIKKVASFSLIVRSTNTQRIQEIHSIIGHILCSIVEEKLDR